MIARTRALVVFYIRMDVKEYLKQLRGRRERCKENAEQTAQEGKESKPRTESKVHQNLKAK
jgi:hypothetical protein